MFRIGFREVFIDLSGDDSGLSVLLFDAEMARLLYLTNFRKFFYSLFLALFDHLSSILAINNPESFQIPIPAKNLRNFD